jgi:hypothetical protein
MVVAGRKQDAGMGKRDVPACETCRKSWQTAKAGAFQRDIGEIPRKPKP